MNPSPLILVSNDDGITSPGIFRLISLMRGIGEVVVVAPNKPQSGMGHAITVGEPLRMDAVSLFDGLQAYECSGTPADCVKLAKGYVLKDRKPDIVVSGINHGGNLSINVLYSGTMSAAIEGALEGLPSIGFSLCNYDRQADMSHVDGSILFIVKEVLKQGLPRGVALNVNIPSQELMKGSLRGIKLCSQADSYWEEVIEVREDLRKRQYFWIEGDFSSRRLHPSTDQWAIAHGYVSVVPCQYNLTAHAQMDGLRQRFASDFK